jgi:hypothetical protein
MESFREAGVLNNLASGFIGGDLYNIYLFNNMSFERSEALCPFQDSSFLLYILSPES